MPRLHMPSAEAAATEQGFGRLLETARFGSGLKQAAIYKHLGWTPDRYSRLESGERSPLFRDLPAIIQALHEAGVPFTLQLLQEFLAAARRRIALQKTYKDEHSDEEWGELFHQLASALGIRHQSVGQLVRPSPPQFLETRHLIKRTAWHAQVLALLEEEQRKKLLVIQGAPGVGKSSEISWMVMHLSRRSSSSIQVVLCDFHSLERITSPEAALQLFLATLLSELGTSLSQTNLSLEVQTSLLIDQLEHIPYRFVVVLDHGECVLQDSGQLSACWQRFFSRLLRSSHRTMCILATGPWPGWYGDEQVFVAESTVPPLSLDESVQHLQQLGLASVPIALLQTAAERVGGIPRGLEWVAALVRQPLVTDEWRELFSGDVGAATDIADGSHLSSALEHLLADPHVFTGSLADDIAPLLDRIIENQRLSDDAHRLLEALSLASIPLGQPALAAICRTAGTRPLRELQRASLLVSYEQRVHVNAMVAAASIRHLTPSQRELQEATLVEADVAWLQSGLCYEREAGNIVYELALLLLKGQRLLDAAQLLIRYGWLAFNVGYALPLAAAATEALKQQVKNAQADVFGRLLLHYWLAPLQGKKMDEHQRVADYGTIRQAVLADQLVLEPPIEVSITHILMLAAMNALQFEEAEEILATCCARLQVRAATNIDLQSSLIEKRAWLLGKWCEYRAEQQERADATRMREQAVALYQQCAATLERGSQHVSAPLPQSFLQKRLAKVLHYAGYHLGKLERFEEALQTLMAALALQEAGHAEMDSLPPLYGDIAQTLLALGRFRQASHFDARAYDEAERLARNGYTFSQEEIHIHRVNRGCLYLCLGRVDEAEALLREALPHIHPRRRMYTLMGQRAFQEIQHWREQRTASPYQLDWRYVAEFRQWAGYDTYWWWAAAGPLNATEQEAWNQWYTPVLDDETKERLGQMIRESRMREWQLAQAEAREPHFHYPALDIDQVHAHMTGFRALDGRIRHDDHLHPVVRLWYLETIEEELTTLQLIEATYEGKSDRVRELNQLLNPPPSVEETTYALSQVRRVILQGRLHAERLRMEADPDAEASAVEMEKATERLASLLGDLGVSVDLFITAEEEEELLAEPPLLPVAAQTYRLVTYQTAQRFIEAILLQAGYEGWRVILDPLSRDPHLEQALQHVYLPTRAIPVDQLKEWVGHELLDGHVSRCVAGSQSLVGLLGIHLKNSLEMEEGLATYKEIENARRQERVHDGSSIWFGTLAVGLASGVLAPAQTFSQLYEIFEALIYLYRLVKRPDQPVQVAQKRAQAIAFARCLRTYRGVPDLTTTGVCYTKDVLYQRGLQKLKVALEGDPTVLARLAVGVVALEHLPELEQMGITEAPHPLQTMMADSHIDEYILSFEPANGDGDEPVGEGGATGSMV